ncbi:MAG: hypothetical protein II921_02890 [Treponema sp.]|nr:hypothetical protein [Treponema sp.]
MLDDTHEARRFLKSGYCRTIAQLAHLDEVELSKLGSPKKKKRHFSVKEIARFLDVDEELVRFVASELGLLSPAGNIRREDYPMIRRLCLFHA